MKKLLIIITLFVSSFFLFCNKEVKAAEYTYDFSGRETLINNDIYPLVKAKAIELFNSYSDTYNNYVIFNSGNYYNISFFNNYNNIDAKLMLYDSYYLFDYKYDYVNYSTSDGISYIKKSLSNFPQKNSSSECILYWSSGLYVSYSFEKITLKLNDFSYEIFSIDEFIFLEELYNKSLNIEEENPHQEEIDKVTNFYTMVIEKIEYLANEISNNYILLFIIGIFIVTFIFLLIFRRFIC